MRASKLGVTKTQKLGATEARACMPNRPHPTSLREATFSRFAGEGIVGAPLAEMFHLP
jgi:hypothetical protein